MKKVKLPNGVTVVESCASCRWKVDNYPIRRCSRLGIDVAPDHRCRRWAVAQKYADMKTGGGYIKTREYLMFANAVACENEQKTIKERIGIEEMRKKYKRITGKGIIEL